jgi:hypothetical protein
MNTWVIVSENSDSHSFRQGIWREARGIVDFGASALFVTRWARRGRGTMDIEEELITFLASVQKGPGKPKRDGTARKVREDKSELRQRNVEIVLSHFGFSSGAHFWPTLEEIAQQYPEITSRERIRQIIERSFTNHLGADPLPVAAQAAEVLAERNLWLEQDYLDELQERGLVGPLEHAVGLLTYLQHQSLAGQYAVYLPSMQPATRSTYLQSEERFIARNSKVKTLKKDLSVARVLPGQAGLAKLADVKRRGAKVDEETLKELVRLSPAAWSGIHDGDFWYCFEDRDNVLVNSAAKTFAVTQTCPIDALPAILANTLTRRSTRVGYPPTDLIHAWITQSRHFSVEENVVRFEGAPGELTDIEKSTVKIARGAGPLTSKYLRSRLAELGFGGALITGTVFHSPLLYVDRSGGKGNYRFSLVSDLIACSNQPSDPYDQFLARLAALGGTDRDTRATARREQSILKEWVFTDTDSQACAICNRPFARRALIVAHKKKRSRCTDSERLDPHIVFPLCNFGCDYLYEHGFVTIRNGKVGRGKPALGQTERNVVDELVGNRVPSRWTRGQTVYFDND